MKTISPDELCRRLKTESLTLLDVRETDELTGELGHIEGIVHIPLGQLPTRLADIKSARSQPIITVCKMGGRATHAGEFLQQAGFTDVIVLEGGMKAWNHSGLPVTTCLN